VGRGGFDASDSAETSATEGGGGGTSPVDASSDAFGTGDHESPDATVAPPTSVPGRVRTLMPFDAGWLFHYGDATGADAQAFADAAWRNLNVPHDWAIEGPNPPASPFSGTAATTGRGAFVPSGVAWYRKHFTLPQSLASDRVYVEFDGVMANSDVYVNGTHLGHHPYGYASFRYDMTSSVQFGTADNVIAVKTDTTVQPAERFYAGAGIYRHVRVIAANPVHVDQYATFVTTPTPTTTAATVHVTTTVVNSGSAAASVSLSGVVSDPSGTALAPVRTPAQTIAAAGSASFTFDVPVANPRLWDLTTPNMYQLVTSVAVGNTAVDDDVTAFGIRELTFNGGLTLNGKSVWLQGAANHQDFHGLGMAAPQRAVQRRLAQLKALGVNAIRTAHDPPSPDFLDLTDRMGFLVLDEFTDVWTAHKYTDVGDYAAFFSAAATTPTGMPAVPAVTGVTNAGATWWQVDFTGWIMRDRNHPSVALYSVGNEIHDGIGTRTPILTKMIAMSHALDPSRDDTQALLDPATAGDVSPGATNGLLDVWGDNYDVTTCISALAHAPTKSGVLTEMTMSTSTWSTVLANPGFSGEFVWSGVDYLGEAVTSTGDPVASYPTIGNAGNALMDELGTPNPNGYAWQPVWGVPRTTPPPTGATPAKVVLVADHPTVLTDENDVSFVKATIADAAGNVVTSATNPVTFALTGPGTIVAVDSGSMTAETFRGNVRAPYRGVAFAIVQATGPGTITVTAQAGNLTSGSATVTASVGTFAPCATAATCN
jgi:beta-galactosidase